jgi:hypothetical protein
MKTPEEIQELIDQARKIAFEEGTKFSGMSYEEGIVAALEWALGITDENPLE